MFLATPAPALDGPQGEGEAVADGATGELDSATATAPMVGAAAAVEAMKAEGATVVDTEAAGEEVAAASTSVAAAGSSAAGSSAAMNNR